MMRLPRSRAIVLIGCLAFLSFASDTAHAADRDPAESGSWLDLSARAKVSRGTSATLTQHLRWDGMIERLDLIAPEATVRHRLRSWWRIEGGYRYLRERDSDEIFQHRHLAFANSRFRVRTSLTALELRMQWQEEFRHELDDGTPRRHFLRTRSKLTLQKLRTITPYASLEAYHRLDSDDDDVSSGTLTKLRAILGAEWSHGSLDYNARYVLVVPVHEDRDPLQHIVSVGVGFDLPR